jgi:hypothetical protein
MPNQLIDTVAEILELSGAAVEKNGERLEALLPPDVSKTLQTSEQATLYFNPEHAQADGELVTFQSDFVDRLFALLQTSGNYANLSLKDLYLKQGAKGAAEQRFTVLNGLRRALDANARHLSYAQFNFKYTAVSDEKKEGLVTAVVNEHTLADASLIATQLNWVESVEQFHQTDFPQEPFEKVYAAACRVVEPIIHQQLAEFHKSLNRRLQRDIHRLTEYYGSLTAEIRRKIERRHLEGREREDEESRIRATEMEMERKITDQREKYALKIHVEPINVLRLFMPAMVVGFEIRFRKAARELPLVWNPLTKDFESVPCQSCSAGLYGFNVCEEKLHVICTDCFKCAGCGRTVCHACHPRKCPKCGGAF